jgi:hypothetical protein
MGLRGLAVSTTGSRMDHVGHPASRGRPSGLIWFCSGLPQSWKLETRLSGSGDDPPSHREETMSLEKHIATRQIYSLAQTRPDLVTLFLVLLRVSATSLASSFLRQLAAFPSPAYLR